MKTGLDFHPTLRHLLCIHRMTLRTTFLGIPLKTALRSTSPIFISSRCKVQRNQLTRHSISGQQVFTNTTKLPHGRILRSCTRQSILFKRDLVNGRSTKSATEVHSLPPARHRSGWLKHMSFALAILVRFFTTSFQRRTLMVNLITFHTSNSTRKVVECGRISCLQIGHGSRRYVSFCTMFHSGQ